MLAPRTGPQNRTKVPRPRCGALPRRRRARGVPYRHNPTPIPDLDQELTVRRWPLVVVLALAPVWIIGILCRSAWTPDEPREADIAWRMTLQTDRTLPQLADTPFLEKPPLSYWMSAAAIEVYGDSPAAARMPNLLYAAITALAIGALAFAMDGGTAAIVAALVAGTAITAFRVQIWLAPDACLLAGCALALLGAYLGYRASPGRSKLFGYTLMHAGAAVGFMAKSAPGWLVPATALVAIIVWERRWSELRRWELYFGFIVQALLIGPWIYEVSRSPHAEEAFSSLFWHNIVGRFTKLAGPAALDYTTGHKNTPGKYFIELPVYLLPWTLLAVAAARRAWDRLRGGVDRSTPWRFAVCAIVPFLLLLTFAATARDIYAAPILLGFAVLIALWLSELVIGGRRLSLSQLDRFAIRGTHVLVAVIAIGFAVVLGALALAAPGLSGINYAINAVVVVAIAVITSLFASNMRRSGDTLRGLAWTYVAYAATLTLSGLAIFPTIDRWQDLPSLARNIHDDARKGPLALLNPDETTIAMMDHRLRTQFVTLDTDAARASDNAAKLVSDWLRSQGPEARVLVKLPGRTPGDVKRLLDGIHPTPAPDDGLAGTLAKIGVVKIVRRYELPEGRRYALLGSPQQ
jgi:4-amino-4-deoxy-L-arabinose transferase-like glycosyltransferase